MNDIASSVTTGRRGRCSLRHCPFAGALRGRLGHVAAVMLAAAHPGSAGNGNWNFNGSDIWSVAARWSSNPTVPGTTAGDVVGLTNDITANRTVTITTGTNVILGTLNVGDSNSTHSFTLALTGGSLTFNNNGAGAVINQLTSSAGDTISASFTLADNLTVNNNTALNGIMGRQMIISGNISESVLGRSLTKAGTGTGALILSGTNSYTGGTNVNTGALIFRNSGALPSTGTATFASGTTIGLGVGSTGFFSATNVNSAFGNTLPNVSLDPNTAIGIDTTAGNFAYTYGGGAGTERSLVKYGANTLTLNGLSTTAGNNYTGTTVIDQGTLAIGSNAVLTGGLTFGSNKGGNLAGTLDLTGASLTTGALTVQTDQSVTNTITIGSGQTLTTNGNVTIGIDGILAATSSPQSRLTVSGASGTWTVNSSGGTFRVGGPNTSNSRGIGGYLDLSSLGTLNADLRTNLTGNSGGTFAVGSLQSNNGVANTLILAWNSTIKAGLLSVRDDNGGGGPDTLSLGSGSNVLHVTTMTVGGAQRSGGTINFAGSSGNLTLRSADGRGRTAINVGNQNTSASGSTASLVDLSGRSSDLLVSTLSLMDTGTNLTSPASHTATFTFDSGVMNADNNVRVGRKQNRSADSSAANTYTATLNIGNGTTNLSNNATLSGLVEVANNADDVGTIAGNVNIAGSATTVDFSNVGSNLLLGQASNTGNATAALNISGGNVTVARGITLGNRTGAGAVTSSIGLAGGSLTLGTAGITTTAGATATLTLNGGTLNMSGNAIGDGTNAITTNFQTGTLRDVSGINGGAGLTKNSAGTLILGGTNTYTGGTTITAGTIQIGNGTIAGSVAGAITNNSALVFNAGAAAQSAGNAIGGSGSVSKIGSGTQTLTGTSNYSGATTVTAGTLALSGAGAINGSSGITIYGIGAKFVQGSSVSVTPTITLTEGTLDGTGTVGAVSVADLAGNIVQNGDGGSSVLTIGSLSFGGDGTLSFANTSLNPTARIVVTGGLATMPANGTITVNLGGSFANGANNLLSYGSFGGLLSDFTLGSVTGLGPRQSAGGLSLAFNNLVFTVNGDTPKWTGNGTNVWAADPVQNWQLVTAATATNYIEADAVLFDDSATGSTSIDISAATVSPSSVTFENSTQDYTIGSTGGFGIGGSAGLSKSGSGSATINTANSYTGGTILTGGTLIAGNASALGANSGTVTVGSGATLTLNNSITQSAVTINNGAIGGAGTLTSSAFTSTGGNVGAVLAGAGALTHSTGNLTLSGNNTYTGGTTINSGAVTLGSGGTLGASGGSLAVNAGSLSLNGNNLGVGALTGSGGTIYNNGAANATLTVGNSDATGSFAGGIANTNISAAGTLGLTKVGTGGFTLSGLSATAANNYSGTTTIDQGTLSLTQNASFTGGLTFGATDGGANAGSMDLTNGSAIFAGELSVRSVTGTANTITIGAGQKLTNNNSVTWGYSFTAGAPTFRLMVSGAGEWDVTASNGTFGGVAGTRGLLSDIDLSGLSTFTANLRSGGSGNAGGTFRVGNTAGNNGGLNSVRLAANSTISADTFDVTSPSGGTGLMSLLLGNGTQIINSDTINLSRGSRDSSNFSFNTADGTLKIRGTDGAESSRANLNMLTGTTTAGIITSVFDVSGHDADLLFGNVAVYGSSAGTTTSLTNTYTATFSFDRGTLNATAFQIASKGSGSFNNPGFGTVNIGGSSNFANTATLGTVTMGRLTTTGTLTAANALLTAALNIDGSATDAAFSTLSMANYTGTAGATVNSQVNILGGSTIGTGGINMAAGDKGIVNSTINLTGGTLSVGTSGVSATNGIYRTITGATVTPTLTLNGGGLNMNGNAIGDATNTITTNFQSGTLRNVSQINGGAGLTKTTGGTLVLDGTNAYTGTTTVSGGTLQLGNGGTTGSLNTSSSISVGAGATFAVNQTDTVTQGTDFSGAGIGGDGNFLQSGSGTSILTAANTYTGTTTVSGGTLQLGNGGTTGSLSTSSSISVSAGATFAVNQTDTVTQGTDFSTAGITGAGNFAQSGSGTTILNAANTYTGTTTISAGTLSASNIVVSGGNSNLGNATSSVTLGAAGSQGTLSYTGNSATYTRGFTIGGAGGGRLDVTTSGQTLTVGTGDITGSGLFTVGGVGNLAITSNLTHTGGLTKLDAGTLSVSGNNTYTGNTTISAGKILITNAQALGATGGSTSVSDGAALELQGAISVGAEPLSLTGSGISSGGALRNVSADNTFGGPVTLAGASRINSDAGTLTLSNTVGGGFILTLGGAGNVSLTGSVADLTGLTKDGAGTATLTGANTFTGATTVSAGTLRLSRTTADNAAVPTDNTAATNDITISGGTLEVTESEQINNNGRITLSSGAFNFGAATGKTETIGALTNNGGTFSTGANTLIGTGSTITFAGGTNTINAGGLVEDPHVVITGGTNTVEGGATAGELRVSSGGLGLEMSNGSNLTLTSDATNGGKLRLQGNLSTSGDSTVTITSGGVAANPGQIDLDGGTRTFTVANGAAATDLSISALISNGGIAKEGDGLLVLGGNNTYDGVTSVNDGTLLINGSQSGANGMISVNLDATLGGSGTSGASSVSLSGGTLTGGTDGGVGTLTFSATTATVAAASPGTSTWLVDIVSGGWDVIHLSGTSSSINLNNFNLLVATVNTPLYVGQNFDIAFANSISGMFGNVGGGPTYTTGDGRFNVSIEAGNTLRLTSAVPEPSTFLFLPVLLIGGIAVARRRMQKASPAAA